MSNLSQFSPQGLMPQFPGLQGAGWPQMNPGQFGQPGAYGGGNAPFGHDSAQAGFGQQFAFGGQANPLQQNPFTQNQFGQSPWATNPYLQGQLGQQSPHSPQYIIAVLGHLAQQFAVHTALTQQIGVTLQQLAQQLAVQMQSHAASLGAGGGQYFGQSPFAVGGYGGFNPGFNPQAQAWGASRSPTIQ
jgi:hypothetical protein